MKNNEKKEFELINKINLYQKLFYEGAIQFIMDEFRFNGISVINPNEQESARKELNGVYEYTRNYIAKNGLSPEKFNNVASSIYKYYVSNIVLFILEDKKQLEEMINGLEKNGWLLNDVINMLEFLILNLEVIFTKICIENKIIIPIDFVKYINEILITYLDILNITKIENNYSRKLIL